MHSFFSNMVETILVSTNRFEGYISMATIHLYVLPVGRQRTF